MRNFLRAVPLAALVLSCSTLVQAAATLTPGAGTIGCNLQAFTFTTLGEPAPGDMTVTLTSDDPSKLLLAKTPTEAGSASITLAVRRGFRETTDYWIQALADSGEATYTVTAPGYQAGKGTVKLAKSGIAITGPYGEAAAKLITTPRGWPTKISFRTGLLDADRNFVQPQFVRGGLNLSLELDSSDPQAGSVTGEKIIIAGGTDSAHAEFKPAAAGMTVLSVHPPKGFSHPAKLGDLEVTVRKPGLAVADDLIIGENLQLTATLSLGEPAPAGGLKVTIKSNNPDKLLVSASPHEKGQPSIVLTLPEKAVNARYYLQALARSGDVTHTASAPGFTERTGSLMLVPSGVIISVDHQGPPDEANMFRPDSAGNERHAFVANLNEKKRTQLVMYTAFLDPKTKRCADISVQPLRGGLDLDVNLSNSNPKVGSVTTRLRLKSGEERTFLPFDASGNGETTIAVATPPGFEKPSNFTEITAIVR